MKYDNAKTLLSIFNVRLHEYKHDYVLVDVYQDKVIEIYADYDTACKRIEEGYEEDYLVMPLVEYIENFL